jgi:hypothetical protein
LTNTAHYKPRHEGNQSEVRIKPGFSQMSMPKSDYPKKHIPKLLPGKGIQYCLQNIYKKGAMKRHSWKIHNSKASSFPLLENPIAAI